MDVRQCKRCNRIFQYRGNRLCPDCVHKMDALFESVRDYLYDHPEATMIEVSQETGASEAEIKGWLREGRLIVSTSSSLLTCELCGETIVSGRFCAACTQKLKGEIETTAEGMRPKPKTRTDFVNKKSSGMHIKLDK
ncbi:MerR family transcriptional regulator [Oscillospiraceae bacterium OttesenSCG-928-F05]|nr:MerR family transcriptional regulator [Oscillospiraceae bacterium OttesenSCG-928-F05]